MRNLLCLAAATLTFLLPPAPAAAQPTDQAHAMIQRGLMYLRATQSPDGSWSAQPGPAITAMVLGVMVQEPGSSLDDPAIARALAYVLSKARPDGGIHAGFLENYNTAICLSGLSRIQGRPDLQPVIGRAQDYLRNLQWAGQTDDQGKTIDESHPFYGGAGYGRHGRPDMSNTQIMLDGLHDSGLASEDPAFQRALVFITRCQASDSNKAPWRNRLASDGGFIYATSQDKDHVGQPESPAGEETVDLPGQGPMSTLRSYGSMTYAGFKSYLYADLDRNDPRVQDAFAWIKQHYTLEQNPGMPEPVKLQGYYYYLMTFSRALQAWGQDRIPVSTGDPRDWRADLINQLAQLQQPDGSWANPADRWMEGDKNLTTAYALIALQHALAHAK